LSTSVAPDFRPNYLALLVCGGALIGQYADEQLVDATAIHIENFDLNTAPSKLVADLGDTPQLEQDESGVPAVPCETTNDGRLRPSPAISA
jgi:hypothetical protein